MAKPTRPAVPDDPTPEQIDNLADYLSVTCFPKGQRVRVRTERQTRTNGMLGTVVSASANACYVALDDFVAAGDPDPFRFGEQELEPIYEGQEEKKANDPDDPGPYMRALDYTTPLVQLGYETNDYFPDVLRKRIPLGTGRLRISVKPYPQKEAGVYWEGEFHPQVAAIIYVEFIGRDGLTEQLQQIVVLSPLDIVDTVREVEAIVASDRVSCVSNFSDELRRRDFPGTPVTTHAHLYRLFGESAEPPVNVDDPDFYLQDLQRQYSVVDAFRLHGVRMRRRPGEKRSYYEMFWIPSAVAETTYDVYLVPKADGSWLVGADGHKVFSGEWIDTDEFFRIDETWTIPANLDDVALYTLADDILSSLRKHQGPQEPRERMPDVDDLDESADEITDYSDYAASAADYNPVMLIHPKGLRQAVREAGYKVTGLYRSRMTHGLTLTAIPNSQERYGFFMQNSWIEQQRFEKTIWDYLLANWGDDLKSKLDVRIWCWPGDTSANPESWNNWVLYADINPHDYKERRERPRYRTKRVKEGVDDPDEIKDLTDYAETTGDTVEVMKQMGYEYRQDIFGQERWLKLWPLPLPVKGKPWSATYTHFRGNPDLWGSYLYALVSADEVYTAGGNYIIVMPLKGETEGDYNNVTSVRRLLLKVEQMARDLPKTQSVEDMQAYLDTQMQSIKAEVNREASVTWQESVVQEMEDPEKCVQCGGKCCKFYPGITAPEDWGAPDKAAMQVRITQAVRSGDYEFDDWYGDPTDEKGGGDFNVRMIRPTGQRGLSVRRDEYERCQMLGDQGCKLPHDERPKQCRELVPGDPTGQHCKDQFSKKQAAIAWMPYQDVTAEVERQLWESIDPDDPETAVATHKPRVYSLYSQHPSGYFQPIHLGTFTSLEGALAHAQNQGIVQAAQDHGYTHIWVEEDEMDSLEDWTEVEKTGLYGPKSKFLRSTGVRYIVTPEYTAQPIPPEHKFVPESQEEPDLDAAKYAETTFDPAQFLEQAGWKLYSTQSLIYYTKTFPTPKPYVLGGMTFTGIEVRIGIDAKFLSSPWLLLFFVDKQNRGLPVNGFQLDRQQVLPWDYEEGEPPTHYTDNNMPIRKAAMQIGSVLANVKWPEGSGALVASSLAEQAVKDFVARLNREAEIPLRSAQEESQEEPSEAEVQRYVDALPAKSQLRRYSREQLRQYLAQRPPAEPEPPSEPHQIVREALEDEDLPLEADDPDAPNMDIWADRLSVETQLDQLFEGPGSPYLRGKPEDATNWAHWFTFGSFPVHIHFTIFHKTQNAPCGLMTYRINTSQGEHHNTETIHGEYNMLRMVELLKNAVEQLRAKPPQTFREIIRELEKPLNYAYHKERHGEDTAPLGEAPAT